MIDREQEQARLLAEQMGANGRAGRDLGWIVALTVALTGLAIASSTIARILDWAAQLSTANLDGVVALVMLVPVGAVVYAVRRYRDVDAARASLHELSRRDSLTGLANRRFLGNEFEAMLRTSRRVNGRIGVFFIDLDGFKKVNDTWGHEVGDQLMIAVADRLTAAAGPNDRVVRYGGDEFIAVCPDVTNSLSVERVAARFLGAIETPFEFGEERLRVSASIGVALTEERCTRAEDVLRDADIAMYQAKARGTGGFVVYDRSMGMQLTPSSAERRLRVALDADELALHYQPIVSLPTGRLVGVSARLRWQDPDRGLVDPDRLLPDLGDTGLGIALGHWVLAEACAQARRWQHTQPDRAGQPGLTVMIDVSARQLAQAGFARDLRHLLDTAGVDPARLTLAVTEDALRHDVAGTWATLRDLDAMGTGLALEGVGAGRSSLSSLCQYRIDLLQIDQSLLDGLGASADEAAVVEHLIGLGRAMGIATLADGVTTSEQVDMLRALGCDLARGDHLGTAQPAGVIDQLLARGAGPARRTPLGASAGSRSPGERSATRS